MVEWRGVLTVVVGVAVALVVVWLALLISLWCARPRRGVLAESLRLLPDLIRLISRLSRDRSLPRGVRVRLGLLLAYLALPLDLVPDFIPILGYADDVIAVLLVLRSVVKIAGDDALRRHWPGTPDGCAALLRLLHRRDATGDGQVRPEQRGTDR